MAWTSADVAALVHRSMVDALSSFATTMVGGREVVVVQKPVLFIVESPQFDGRAPCIPQRLAAACLDCRGEAPLLRKRARKEHLTGIIDNSHKITLLPRYRENGYPWSDVERNVAQEVAWSVQEAFEAGTRTEKAVILVGKRVARAFGIEIRNADGLNLDYPPLRDYLTWSGHGGRELGLMPGPAIYDPFWRSAKRKLLAKQFLQDAQRRAN